MNNFSVKKQLSLAFGTLAILVLLVSMFALRGLSAANERFSGYVAGPANRQDLVLGIASLANLRAVGVRDMVLVKTPVDRDSAKAMAIKAHATLGEHLTALKKSIADSVDATERDRALVSAIDKAESRYGPVALAIVELASAGNSSEAIDKMNVECRPLLATLLAATNEYVTYADEQVKLSIDASSTAHSSQRSVLIGMSILATLVAIALGWLITRRLVASLGAEPVDLGHTVSRIAAGDLSPVQGAAGAPTGSVLASMGAMQVQLVGLIGQVRAGAESIATASAQIAQGNNDLSQRTEEQASSLEETAASMEELGSTVRQNADNAKQANQLAMSASAVAIRGGEVVSQVVETMRGINDSSKKIADIISVIDGIAFQTNILALNAAVEAARAGEQGRGFAVVASEVRSLAGRSADAAKEIKSLITASVERVEQGTVLVDQAGTTMTEVVGSIKRVTDIMGEISSASSEQSTGVSQVGEAVSQMDQVTQQNAALVEESAAAAESLKVQALQLVQAVAVFNLGQGAVLRPTLAPVGPVTGARTSEGRAKSAAKRPVVAKGKTVDRKPADVGSAQAVALRTGTDDWEAF